MGAQRGGECSQPAGDLPAVLLPVQNNGFLSCQLKDAPLDVRLHHVASGDLGSGSIQADAAVQ